MAGGVPVQARQFVLGVDLDGVVADFARGLKPIAAEWLGVAPESLTDEISYGFNEWGLEAAGGYDALHRYAVKERELFARLPPVDGAPAVLRRLDTIPELRIRIITHRLYIHWFHREAIQQTTAWLERHGIPYWDLCFMRDKAAVGADLYLEDNPANIATRPSSSSTRRTATCPRRGPRPGRRSRHSSAAASRAGARQPDAPVAKPEVPARLARCWWRVATPASRRWLPVSSPPGRSSATRSGSASPTAPRVPSTSRTASRCAGATRCMT
jgi:hypothetical protein